MKKIEKATPTASVKTFAIDEPETAKRNLKPLWIALAFAALIIITLLPNNGDLPVAGQRGLAILACAVILWVTEAVS